MSDVFGLYPRPPQAQSQDPMDTMGKAVGLARGITATQMGQLQIETAKLQNLNQTLGGLMMANADRNQIKAKIIQGVNENLFSPQQGADAIAQLAQMPDEATDDGKRATHQWLMGHLGQGLSALEATNRILGTPSLFNLGNVAVPGVLGGGAPGSAPTRTTGEVMPIGGPSQLQEVTEPGSQRTTLVRPPAPTGQPGADTSLDATMPQTGPRALTRSPGAGGGGTGTGAYTGRGEGTGLVKGLGEPELSQYKGNAEDFENDRRFSGNIQASLFPLTQALQASRGLDVTQLGPTSDVVRNIRNALVSLGIAKADQLPELATGKEIEKYLQAWVVGQGAPTDMARSMVQMANPSMEQGKGAMEHLLATTIGMVKARAAIANDFAGDPKTPRQTGTSEPITAGYGEYKRTHAANYNPLVYAWPSMGADQRQTILTRMRQDAQQTGNPVPYRQFIAQVRAKGNVAPPETTPPAPTVAGPTGQ